MRTMGKTCQAKAPAMTTAGRRAPQKVRYDQWIYISYLYIVFFMCPRWLHCAMLGNGIKAPKNGVEAEMEKAPLGRAPGSQLNSLN